MPWLLAAIATFAPLGFANAPATSRFSDSWPELSRVDDARKDATDIAIAFVDHVTRPRGSEGLCRASGKFVNVERGKRLVFGRGFTIAIPCSAIPGAAETKHVVPMTGIEDNSWARLFYSPRGLVDYQPLTLTARSESS